MGLFLKEARKAVLGPGRGRGELDKCACVGSWSDGVFRSQLG